MSPRNYDNRRRRAAAEQTRAKIVEAAFEVHGEQGIANARLEDIARRAGVSIGTVYRHFPEYEVLVEACKHRTFETIPPPSADEIPDGVSIAQMVDRVVGYYEQTGGMLEMMRRDSDAFEVVGESTRQVETGIAAWVEAAAGAGGAAAHALMDHRTWTAMQKAGVADARALLVDLVDKVTRHG